MTDTSSHTTELVQFLGKDNIVFHSIIWPALLMAYNGSDPADQYILPTQLPANEFLNLECKKFSTSRGHAVWLNDILANYHPDYIRYYLASIIPENQDSNFQRTEFQDKCNNLCDTLGNLFARVTSLSIKYNDGVLMTSDCRDSDLDINIKSQLDIFSSQIDQLISDMIGHISSFKLRDGLSDLMQMFALGNKLVNDLQPRALAKTDIKTSKQILYIIGSYIITIAIAMEPYMPYTSQNILDIYHIHNTDQDIIKNILRQGTDKNIMSQIAHTNISLSSLSEKADYLFTKITDEQIADELAKLHIS